MSQISDVSHNVSFRYLVLKPVVAEPTRNSLLRDDLHTDPAEGKVLVNAFDLQHLVHIDTVGSQNYIFIHSIN